MVMTIGKVSKAEDQKLYPETQYYGENGHDVYKRLWPDGNSERLPLEPSLKLANHSPTGFSWGYLGSGCSQLSLALLLDATSVPETALNYYQEFKQVFVANWEVDAEWMMFRSDIIRWLRLRYGENIKTEEN